MSTFNPSLIFSSGYDSAKSYTFNKAYNNLVVIVAGDGSASLTSTSSNVEITLIKNITTNYYVSNACTFYHVRNVKTGNAIKTNFSTIQIYDLGTRSVKDLEFNVLYSINNVYSTTADTNFNYLVNDRYGMIFAFTLMAESDEVTDNRWDTFNFGNRVVTTFGHSHSYENCSGGNCSAFVVKPTLNTSLEIFMDKWAWLKNEEPLHHAGAYIAINTTGSSGHFGDKDSSLYYGDKEVTVYYGDRQLT